jgi:hypothetical protein
MPGGSAWPLERGQRCATALLQSACERGLRPRRRRRDQVARPVRGRPKWLNGSARDAQAARRARAPGARAELGDSHRPVDRCPLGRGPAGERTGRASDVRRRPSQRSRRDGDRGIHAGAWVLARGRGRRGRCGTVPRPRERCPQARLTRRARSSGRHAARRARTLAGSPARGVPSRVSSMRQSVSKRNGSARRRNGSRPISPRAPRPRSSTSSRRSSRSIPTASGCEAS